MRHYTLVLNTDSGSRRTLRISNPNTDIPTATLAAAVEKLIVNDVYDNTRIIIVSDHGRGSGRIPENITLPNGSSVLAYNTLLLVKDFNARTAPSQSNECMTNGDVPLFALEGIIANPVNPFTGIPLKPDKDDGITITTIGAVSTYRHNKYTYNIGKNQWLHVRDNIFDPKNWKAVGDFK